MFHSVLPGVGLRDRWQRVLAEVFASEFGPEIARELAVLSLRQRQERIRNWYRVCPEQSFLLLLPHRWNTVHFKMRVLHTIAAEQGQSLTAGAATAIANEISALEEILSVQEAEQGKPEMALLVEEEHLRRAERVLTYASTVAHDLGRPLSIEGGATLQTLRLKMVTLMTQKSRVQLLLDDFERFHEPVAEADRSNVDRWLGKLRDLHLAYERVVNRMKEVLRAEEEIVHQGFSADANAFDRFEAELAYLDKQYAELRRTE